MKSMQKVLLLGAFALIAIAISAAPSEAAKKKKAEAKCSGVAMCAANCKGKSCELMSCGPDGKWYSSMFSKVCSMPDCPSKC